MLLKIKFSRICKHSQDVLDYMKVYNISRLKFSLISPKTTKSVKIFLLEIFRLYGNLVPTCFFPFENLSV